MNIERFLIWVDAFRKLTNKWLDMQPKGTIRCFFVRNEYKRMKLQRPIVKISRRYRGHNLVWAVAKRALVSILSVPENFRSNPPKRVQMSVVFAGAFLQIHPCFTIVSI